MQRIYSVGYAQHSPDSLKELVTRLRATLVDVRSRPSGRVKRGFSKADLTALLGDRYEWHGKDLGGMGQGATPAGIERLAKDDRRLILMCMEDAPGDCHRFQSVGLQLLLKGIEVHHVYHDWVITTSALKAALDDPDPEAEPEGTDLADEFRAAALLPG
ncbi:hypothetical protein [Gemmata sp.]|uniref:hypothetical protein n=1 Tax=Gemmata sp. TaxID=1914242 RepID=UPI003F6FF6A7